METARPFLTAAWRHLVLLNYNVDPELLAPIMPAGTELATWHGNAVMSLVGFRFVDTRVLGFRIPGHRHFDEINLRFYVKRWDPDVEAWRRGVVFIREIVPRRLVALTARLIYNEPYVTRKTRHRLDQIAIMAGDAFDVEYAWREGTTWNALGGSGSGPAGAFAPGSEAEYITEHYWGYTRLSPTRSAEYHVQHPPWQVWSLSDAGFQGDATKTYGRAFASVLRDAPRSAFLALGSEVAVFHGSVFTTRGHDWPAA